MVGAAVQGSQQDDVYAGLAGPASHSARDRLRVLRGVDDVACDDRSRWVLPQRHRHPDQSTVRPNSKSTRPHTHDVTSTDYAANLLCAQVNAASYPRRDGKWIVAYGWMVPLCSWLRRWYVCRMLRASTTDGRIMRCGIISSCQSSARYFKTLLATSRTHVSNAMTSSWLFRLLYTS